MKLLFLLRFTSYSQKREILYIIHTHTHTHTNTKVHTHTNKQIQEIQLFEMENLTHKIGGKSKVKTNKEHKYSQQLNSL